MSSFDAKFNELQAQHIGGMEMLVAEFPEAAMRALAVIAGAEDQAEVEATVQADEARANAIAGLITQANQVLEQVVPEFEVLPLEPEV